jgi:hypothetical protein
MDEREEEKETPKIANYRGNLLDQRKSVVFTVTLLFCISTKSYFAFAFCWTATSP